MLCMYWAVGWDGSEILCERTDSLEDFERCPFYGSTYTLTVCAYTADEDSVPPLDIEVDDFGHIVVVLDDGTGTVRTFRCMSYFDGFTEVT